MYINVYLPSKISLELLCLQIFSMNVKYDLLYCKKENRAVEQVILELTAFVNLQIKFRIVITILSYVDFHIFCERFFRTYCT